MTDEALSGGVDAPADTQTIAVEQDQVRVPDPLGSQTPARDEPKPDAKPEAPKTAGEAIKRAQEQVKAKEAEAKAKADKPETKDKPDAKVDAKAEQKAEKQRDETGKFKPAEAKEGQQDAKPVDQQARPVDKASPLRDAPSRFDEAAKAEWEKAPESVKGATHRVMRELEQGIQKYKESADRYEKVREYDELARKNGYEGVHESLKRVSEIEDAFQRSPIDGFQKIADHFGLSLRAVAAHIMGQKPEQVQAQQDSTIASLKSELATLKQQLSGVTTTIQQQREADVTSKVQAFAKEHPRFDELSSDIEFFLKSGRTQDLQEAYELAERLNPAPQPVASPNGAHTATIEEPAHTRTKTVNPAGQKSIAGAPTSGSNPQGKKPSAPSIREALKRAQASVG